MRIFTDKKYREHIERIKYEHDKDRYIQERLDRLSEELHQLEWRVQVLERKCDPAIPVCDATVCNTERK